MRTCYLVFLQLFLLNYSKAQNIGIGTTTPAASAILDVTASGKGILIPRMTSANRNALAAPAKGLQVMDTTVNQLYWYDGTKWKNSDSTNAFWRANGNAGTNALFNFIGTTDNTSLQFKVNNQPFGLLATNNNIAFGRSAGGNATGSSNIAIGASALGNNVSGQSNIAIGINASLFGNTLKSSIAIGGDALRFSNISNTIAIGDSALRTNGTGAFLPNDGFYNVAIGSKALSENTLGYRNTAAGFQSIKNNTVGVENTGFGAVVLNANTEGSYNTAIGSAALASNIVGLENTAVGAYCQHYNIGSSNSAFGFAAMLKQGNTNSNTAIGAGSLRGDITSPSVNTGSRNAALGANSLFDNSTGNDNVAIGFNAFRANSAGSKNVAIGSDVMRLSGINAIGNTVVGFEAGYNLEAYGNVFIGEQTGKAVTAGFDNVWIGKQIGITGAPNYNNTVAIGSQVNSVTGNNMVRVGNAFVTSIGGQVSWSTLSDARFKKNIKDDIPGIEFIKLLKPVSYTYDIVKLQPEAKAIAALQTVKRFTGFLAQDVEKAAAEINFTFSGIDKPDDANGYYSLRYAEFTVPLVKAVQQQQALIEQLIKQVQELKVEMEKIKVRATK
jgi:trimeric autotransporter adhesin